MDTLCKYWDNDSHVFVTFTDDNHIYAVDKQNGDIRTLPSFDLFAVVSKTSVDKMFEISERRSTGKDPLERMVCGMDMDE